MIKIDEVYSIHPYTYGWELHQITSIGVNKDGDEVENVKITYYTTFDAVAKKLIDLKIKSAGSLEEVIRIVRECAADCATLLDTAAQ